MNRPALPVLVAAIALLPSPAVSADDGCASAAAGPFASLAQTVVDQDHVSDIRVLRAERTSMMQPGPGFDFDACVEIGPSANPAWRRLDCTAAIEARIAAERGPGAGPLAHRFVVLATQDPEGGWITGSSDTPCRLTEIETVTRAGALAEASSFGFHVSGHSRLPRAIPKDALVAVGEAVDRHGEQVVRHRFFAAFPCWAGTGSSSHHATYEFKPYVDFLGSDGIVYRNWEPVSRNHLLTGGAGATGFDRTHDLLQP